MEGILLKRFLAVWMLFAFLFSIFAPFEARAQDNRQLVQEDDKKEPKRIALVIGNGAYTKAKALPNPPNDAADMAKALKDLGFEVISGVNQNKRQMDILIREFGTKLANSGGVGLFYYAGHGIQVGGENYLVPVEADIPEEDEVQYVAVPLGLVLAKMTTAKNDLNIIILDACRNNPFARSWRAFRDSSNTDGLAKISPPTGTLVLYATEPGKVASDGAGRNGLFTEALLKQINKPNLEYDQMVKAVSADVWQKSNKQQLPWKEGNSLTDFYFAKTQADTQNPKPTTVESESVFIAKDKAAQEREAWDLVKNSADAEDFRFFLKEFPNGANAEKAKIRLEELVWFSVKSSTDKTRVQAYLTEFPTGANASAARIKLRQLESAIKPTTPDNSGYNPVKNTNNISGYNPVMKTTAGKVSKATLPGGVEMSFAYIPAGEFQMGSDNGELDEKPVHTVRISQGFWMQTTEVTQAQWKAMMGTLPSRCDYGELKGNFLGGNKPIICVNWDDTQEFVRQMNAKNDGYKYRLPTEAEWEYAARAGTMGDYAGYLDGIAWYGGNSGSSTHDVGTKQPNAWGLYDMHGNVNEWVQDWYESYPSWVVTDPTGPASGSGGRVHRGGSWENIAGDVRSANRDIRSPLNRGNNLGFRLVRY